jgi:hypothetical protein
MFVVCAAIMVVVSLATPAPELSKLAGLTFATANMKLDTITVAGQNPRAPHTETRAQHNLNLAMSALLLLTVISLWVYFR